MSTVDVNDTTIHYERSGSGPTILFVHGIFGNADGWADQSERLSDQYTCVRYDRRGYTRSNQGPAIITDALHADDAAALIEALDLAPCLVVGSSLGGAIAVEVAFRYGHLLRGVLLSEPSLFSLDADAGPAIMGLLGPPLETAMAAGGPSAAVDAFLSLICPGLWSINEARKASYRANAEIGFIDMESPSLEVTSADLAAISVPALVVSGGVSHPSLRSIAHMVAAALPDARFVEIDGSGHVPYAERPDEFANVVRLFAAELDHRLGRVELDLIPPRRCHE